MEMLPVAARFRARINRRPNDAVAGEPDILIILRRYASQLNFL